MNTQWALCGDLAGSLRLSQEPMISFGPKLSKILRCPHGHRLMPVLGQCDAIFDVSTGYKLAMFHNVSLLQILEATMPATQYNYNTVTLSWSH